jgi:redox-sensitive bicupin YhaK (pirin superfamily)
VVGWRYKPGVAEQRKAETTAARAAHGGKGKAGTEIRGVHFWVNLARKDKGVEPSAQILPRYR